MLFSCKSIYNGNVLKGPRKEKGKCFKCFKGKKKCLFFFFSVYIDVFPDLIIHIGRLS